MDEKWKVIVYKNSQGNAPVNEFILTLGLKAQTKVYNTINMLRDYGVSLRSEHMKKLTGTELWELRILGSDSIRIIYVAITGKTFLLLHAFKKKKQEIPQKEIKTVLERLADFKSRM